MGAGSIGDGDPRGPAPTFQTGRHGTGDGPLELPTVKLPRPPPGGWSPSMRAVGGIEPSTRNHGHSLYPAVSTIPTPMIRPLVGLPTSCSSPYEYMNTTLEPHISHPFSSLYACWPLPREVVSMADNSLRGSDSPSLASRRCGSRRIDDERCSPNPYPSSPLA